MLFFPVSKLPSRLSLPCLLTQRASVGLLFSEAPDQKLGSSSSWIFHTLKRCTLHDVICPPLSQPSSWGRNIRPCLTYCSPNISPLSSSLELFYVTLGTEGSLLDFQNRAAFPQNNKLIFLSGSLKMSAYFLFRKFHISVSQVHIFIIYY